MGFITQNGNSETYGAVQSGYWVASNKPFDKRDVVEYRADLTDDSLWILTNRCDIRHSGMIVAVTKDIAKFNGLYYLQDEDYCDCFVQAESGELQDNRGWIKLPFDTNGTVMLDNYTIKDGTLPAIDDDIQGQPGLHVVRVDGGWF